MHKLMEYICDELDELERKADKDGKLSMAEVQYMDTLAHAKKNLLKADEMMDGEYSMAMDGSYASDGRSYRYDDGRSMARGRGRNARRDAMGRYSRRGSYSYAEGVEDMITSIRESMHDLPEDTKREAQKFIQKLEQAM